MPVSHPSEILDSSSSLECCFLNRSLICVDLEVGLSKDSLNGRDHAYLGVSL